MARFLVCDVIEQLPDGGGFRVAPVGIDLNQAITVRPALRAFETEIETSDYVVRVGGAWPTVIKDIFEARRAKGLCVVSTDPAPLFSQELESSVFPETKSALGMLLRGSAAWRKDFHKPD